MRERHTRHQEEHVRVGAEHVAHQKFTNQTSASLGASRRRRGRVSNSGPAARGRIHCARWRAIGELEALEPAEAQRARAGLVELELHSVKRRRRDGDDHHAQQCNAVDEHSGRRHSCQGTTAASGSARLATKWHRAQYGAFESQKAHLTRGRARGRARSCGGISRLGAGAPERRRRSSAMPSMIYPATMDAAGARRALLDPASARLRVEEWGGCRRAAIGRNSQRWRTNRSDETSPQLLTRRDDATSEGGVERAERDTPGRARCALDTRRVPKARDTMVRPSPRSQPSSRRPSPLGTPALRMFQCPNLAVPVLTARSPAHRVPSPARVRRVTAPPDWRRSSTDRSLTANATTASRTSATRATPTRCSRRCTSVSPSASVSSGTTTSSPRARRITSSSRSASSSRVFRAETHGRVRPKRFIQRLKRDNELFRSFMHQDAHEFFNYTLNECCEILEKQERAANPDPPGERRQIKTWIHDIFQGHLTNQTKCLWCENVTSRDERPGPLPRRRAKLERVLVPARLRATNSSARPISSSATPAGVYKRRTNACW